MADLRVITVEVVSKLLLDERGIVGAIVSEQDEVEDGIADCGVDSTMTSNGESDAEFGYVESETVLNGRVAENSREPEGTTESEGADV